MRFLTPGTASATDKAPVGFGRAAGMPPDQMRAAHFILCAALDDIIGDTAWGQRTGWSECCLTRTFYQSLEPGPSLLTLLQHIRGEPDRHRNELELFSVCLALGFEGDTRTQANGAVEFRRDRAWVQDHGHRVRGSVR